MPYIKVWASNEDKERYKKHAAEKKTTLSKFMNYAADRYCVTNPLRAEKEARRATNKENLRSLVSEILREELAKTRPINTEDDKSY